MHEALRWINSLVAPFSLIVSVVALILSLRAQREANAAQKRIVEIEERRDEERRQDLHQAKLQPALRKMGNGSERLFLLNRGSAEARNVRVMLDGKPLVQHCAGVAGASLPALIGRGGEAILITHAQAERLSNYRAELHERSLANRIAAACGLGAVGTQADINDLFQRISKRDLSPTGREVISYAIAYWAQDKKQPAILRRLLDGPKTVCRGAISALEGDRAGMSLRVLLEKYSEIPFEVAEAVRRTAKPRDVPQLKRFVGMTKLDTSSRDLLIALLELGDGKTVRWVAELVASKDYWVNFWNVPALARSMSKAATAPVKPWLKSLTKADEFWKYTGAERGKRPLPVKDPENLYLFKRLVGITLPVLCDKKDWPLLRRLVFHDYWLIQAGAAERIAQFAGTQELNDLTEDARRTAKDEADPGVVYALNLVDEKLYGSD